MKGMELAKVDIELEALEKILLPPFKGSTFRGALGRFLKDMVCIRRRDWDCRECSVNNKCSYPFIFETGVHFSKGETIDTGGIPQPFVLEPPDEEKEVYDSGDIIRLSLVLIGEGTGYMPYFISAFDRMGAVGIGKARGRFKLKKVIDGYSGRVVYDYKSGELNPVIKKISVLQKLEITGGTENINSCLVSMVTPLRIKKGGQLAGNLDFEMLVRAVIRRIVYLSEYFSPESPGFDFNHFIDRAKQVITVRSRIYWRDWERYSSRQEKRMKLGGMMGQVEFSGDLGAFWPLLMVGQELHIGKNTTFGLGKYVLK